MLSLNFNDNVKEKMEYFIKFICDSEYYYSKYTDVIIQNLKIILAYYKEYLFESKKNEINLIQNYIDNKIGNYICYMKDINIAKKNE